MRYTKPPLSFEQQADLLLSRELIADRQTLIECLRNVNYYRLSGYLYPYREENNKFKPNTTFEIIWRHYTFDRRLRFVVMDAVERVEVSIRTQLINALSLKTGAFGYTENSAFPKLPADKYARLIDDIETAKDESKETFVSHFNNRYGDCHRFLPLWMAGETISFGKTLTMYNGTSEDIRKQLATFYKVPDSVLTSWLRTINAVRNICAHHGRLWNREMGCKPFLPNERKYPEWHRPVAIPQNKIFGVLTILRFFLKMIAPKTKWESRLKELLDNYKDISKESMGFPNNWEQSPLWQ